LLQVDREALKDLPPSKQQEALEILQAYESKLRNNPLIGYRPHEKQKEFHEGPEQLKAFLGGNRSGKTTAGIADNLIQTVDEDCLPAHLKPYKKWQPPFYCRVIVPDFKKTLEGAVFQKIREWAPRDQLVGDSFDKAYSKSQMVLHFKNGSWWDFATFEQDLDKFGGVALHRVHYDEEPPFEIRRESTMRLIDYAGDELFTMTPLHGMTWMFDTIWEAWQKRTLDDGKVVLVDMDDNPYIDPKAKARALAGLTKEEREARKSGRFVHFAGMIYDEFSRNFHVIPEISEVPPTSRIYVGIDPGMRHMAAVVWCYLTNEDLLVQFDELALQGHTVKQVAENIKLINQKWGQKTETGAIAPLHPDWYVIDPSARNIVHQTGRSDQMEFTDHGIVTILGQNSVTAGINRVKERLQAKRFLITANCQQTIDQFRKYRWATPNRTEDDSKEKPVKTDDHLLDALRYVVASRPYAPKETENEAQMHPHERAAWEEISGKKYGKRKPIQTPMGAIFQ
jgi:phage terminase large subunit-like protein